MKTDELTAHDMALSRDEMYAKVQFGIRPVPKKSYYKNKLKKTVEKGNNAILCSAYRKTGDSVNFCDIHVFVVEGTHCRWLMWAGRVDRGRVKELEKAGIIYAVNGTNNLWRNFTMDPIELSSLLENTRKWLAL